MSFFGKSLSVAWLLFLAAAGVSGGEARHAAVRVLSSEQLHVEVMDPTAADRYYRGVRFSPVAGVLRVAMEGRDFLFAPAGHDPLTGNGGLAMEFGMPPPETEDGPDGFDEAKEGGGFLKIGVGVLKKQEGAYRVYAPYELIDLARTEVTWSADRAVFFQESPGVGGYSYQLEAEVRVVGNEVRIRCRLVNPGTRPFTTEQYAHNFFLFDGAPGGPGYEIDFPYEFDARIPKPVIEARGRSLMFKGEITAKMKAADAFITPKESGRSGDALLVRHPGSGMQIEATVSVPTIRTVVHATSRYICPEQFVKISLNPGESAEWLRTYLFSITPTVKN